MSRIFDDPERFRLVGSREERPSIFHRCVAVLATRDAGLPVIGYTWFPVFSLIDWRWRRGPYEASAYWCHMGLWDIDEQMRRNRTPLVDRYAAIVAAGAPEIEAVA